MGKLPATGECLALKSRFDDFPLALHAPANHVSQGTTPVLSTKPLWFGWVWSSVEI